MRMLAWMYPEMTFWREHAVLTGRGTPGFVEVTVKGIPGFTFDVLRVIAAELIWEGLTRHPWGEAQESA